MEALDKIKVAYMAGVLESGHLIYDSNGPIIYLNTNYNLVWPMATLYCELVKYKDGLVKWYHILLLMHSYYSKEISYEELIQGLKHKTTRKLRNLNMQLAYAIGANTFILSNYFYYSLPYFTCYEHVEIDNIKDIVKAIEACSVRNNKVNNLILNINAYEEQKQI